MRAFRLAYDGRPFYGFQRQPDVSTVEDSLFAALAELGVLDSDARKPAGYAAAGRTDAGVSAVAQTVAFEAPEWCTARALNSALPGPVRAWAFAEVPDDFHATHDAERREYTYHLHAPDADLDAAERAVDALSGEHDFHNLTIDEEGTVRDVSASVEQLGEFLVVRVESDGFPREFVRRFVGVVEEVAVGGATIHRIERVLGEDHLEGPEGVPRTPPEPLVLTRVDYPDVMFTTDADAAASARGVFQEARVAALERARVADAVVDRIR